MIQDFAVLVVSFMKFDRNERTYREKDKIINNDRNSYEK